MPDARTEALEAKFAAEDAQDASGSTADVPSQRDVVTFDGFAGSASATPREVDGEPYPTNEG